MSDKTRAQALLFVYGECGDHVTEDQFHDWYDNEHAPLRLTVPGFLTASRYKALDAPPKTSPKWLALYDITSKDLLQSQPYKDLRLKASDNERHIIGNLELLNRRLYDLVYSSKAVASGSKEAAKFLYVVHMQVMGNKDSGRTDLDGQESHFVEWYTSTRIPILAHVPGYLRSRVYRLAEHNELAGKATTDVNKKPPFKFLAIHEWSKEGVTVVDLPEFKKCMSDAEPWKMEGEEVVAEMEDRLFALYKSFV